MNNIFFATNDFTVLPVYGTYSLPLVLLSFVIITAASYIALSLSQQMVFTTEPRLKRILQISGAFAYGAGIWAMHFVGMLAYKMNMPMHFNMPLTFLSMLFAVASAYGVLEITRHPFLKFKGFVLSSCLLGVAISSMHYVGMFAMEMEADIRYIPSYFFASLFISVFASAAAVAVIFFLGSSKKSLVLRRTLSAAVMGLSVCSVHYLGMRAAVFIPTCTPEELASMTGNDSAVLPFVITAVLSVILGMNLSLRLYKGELRAVQNNETFPVKPILIAFVLTMLLTGWTGMNSYTVFHEISSEMKHENALSKSVADISAYRENMRSSIVESVASGSPQSFDQYTTNRDLLGQALKSIEGDFPDLDQDAQGGKGYIRALNDSYAFLVDFDEQVYALLRQNQREKVLELLLSENYQKNVRLFRDGVTEFQREVQEKAQEKLEVMADNVYRTIYLVMSLTVVLIVLWFFTFRSLRHWRHELLKTKNNLAIGLAENSEQKMLLGTLLDNIPMGILAKNVKNDFRYIMLNKMAEQMFAFTKEDMIGRVDYDFFPKEQSDRFRKIDTDVMNGGKLIEIDAEPVTTPKGTFTAHTLKVPIYDDAGNPSLLLAIFEDVTEKIASQEELRHAKEAAEQANLAKSEFLANVSHEIRTPMNGILGLTRLLSESKLEGEQAQFAEAILKSSESLLLLLNDILDFSKIEAGEFRLEESRFNLKESLQAVIDLLSPLASKKGLIIDYLYDAAIPKIVLGDPLRVNQIIANLLGNALKFTEKGKVTLAVYINENSQFVFAVQDTGIGIPVEIQGALFKKFSQGDTSRTRKYGGTGLGLAISKSITELMGGKISFVSLAGLGATFTVELPLKVAKDQIFSSAKTTDIQSKNLIDFSKFAILIVDDHPINMLFARKLVKKMGFTRISEATDGSEAVKNISDNLDFYDIILMDCQMPEMDGYEATRNIRRIEKENIPPLRRVPIIAMTADAMVGTKEACYEAGMDEYITKPIDEFAFRNALRKCLSLPPEELLINLAAHKKAEIRGEPPVDLSLLKDYADQDITVVREMLELYCQRTSADLHALLENCIEGESKTWSETAHALKGAASFIGAKRLQSFCAEAQSMLIATYSERRNLLTLINTEYAIILDYLKSEQIIPKDNV